MRYHEVAWDYEARETQGVGHPTSGMASRNATLKQQQAQLKERGGVVVVQRAQKSGVETTE